MLTCRNCRSRLVVAALLLSGMVTLAQAGDLASLVAPDAKVTKVAGDCKFTEGPAWSPAGYLLFSDIPNDRVMKVTPDGGVSEYLKPSGKSNGLMFDATGRLYMCRTVPQGISRVDAADGSPVFVADQFDGKRFNTPNDLALDAHGGLYFTDPIYGQNVTPSQPVQGVYYVAESGLVTRVIDSLQRPNGVLVSADGKRLLVAEPNKRELYAYEIKSPGVLGEGQLIFTADEADGGGPDGMSLDEHGNIYATYKSLIVLDPTGALIGKIEVPEVPSNCAFGGTDGKTLYITARTSLYKLSMQVTGIALQPAGKLPALAAAAVETKTEVAAEAKEDKDAKEPEKTREVKAKEITLTVPESWKQKEARGFRAAEFALPPQGDEKIDGEYTVFFFPMGGGDAAANTTRWIGQFVAEGRKSKVFTGKTKDGRYTLVDVSGTYNKSVGPPVAGQTKTLPNWRMLAVVLETEGGNYFLKLDAGTKTTAAAEKAFRASFGADPKAETEKKVDAE